LKAAEALEANKRQLEEQKAAYERQMVDDEPPTLEEVSDEQIQLEQLMKTK